MATGPGDELEAAGRGHLRASHADREQVIGTLKTAFVQGRLAKDEFDQRVGQALASRTYAELSAVTADIPAGLTPAKPPAPARAPGGEPVLRPGPVITMATVLYAGVWVYAIFFPKGGDGPQKAQLILDSGLVYLIILATCVGLMVALRRVQRSGGQSPRRPAAGAGGQASRTCHQPTRPGGFPRSSAHRSCTKPSPPAALAGLAATAPTAHSRAAGRATACRHGRSLTDCATPAVDRFDGAWFRRKCGWRPRPGGSRRPRG